MTITIEQECNSTVDRTKQTSGGGTNEDSRFQTPVRRGYRPDGLPISLGGFKTVEEYKKYLSRHVFGMNR